MKNNLSFFIEKNYISVMEIRYILNFSYNLTFRLNFR